MIFLHLDNQFRQDEDESVNLPTRKEPVRLEGGYPAMSEANPDYQSESRGDVVSVSGVGTCGAGSIDLSILRRRSHETLNSEGADF